MRNSSLVERFCAENVAGLKVTTEDVSGGSFRTFIAVGERCGSAEGRLEGLLLERPQVRMLT